MVNGKQKPFVSFFKKLKPQGSSITIFVPYFWLSLFFLLPLILIFVISLTQTVDLQQPPYSPIITSTEDTVRINIFFGNYLALAEDQLYVLSIVNSVKIATISTFFCLLIGFPMAYGIARSTPTYRNTLLMMIILPFWTSFLIRVYAWIGILGKENGLLNGLLLWLGIIDKPLDIIYSDFAVYIGIVYSYLPFMILPLYATLEKLDNTLLEAAADLGSKPTNTFFTITVPLAMPGIIAGCLLVFIPAVGEFVIPELLGDASSPLIGQQVRNVFSYDWPMASTLAMMVLLVLVIPIFIFQYLQNKQTVAK